MRDEEPAAGGLDALLAAARAKAVTMQPRPTLWQRLAAGLRRPTTLAFATVLVLAGGAVLVGRHTAPEDEAMQAPAPVQHEGAVGAAPAAGAVPAVATPPASSDLMAGSGPAAADPAGTDLMAGSGPTVADPAGQPPATTGEVGGLANGAGAGAVSGDMGDKNNDELARRKAESAVPVTPGGPRAGAAHHGASRGAALESDKPDDRPAPPSEKSTLAQLPALAPADQEAKKEDGKPARVDDDRGEVRRRSPAAGAPPPPAAAAKPSRSSMAPAPDKGSAPAGGGGADAPAPPAPPAPVPPAPVPSVSPASDDAAPTTPASSELEQLYRKCEAAAQRGECAVVKQLMARISRRDRSYGAKAAKSAEIARCLSPAPAAQSDQR
jgi:hypothetical protein